MSELLQNTIEMIRPLDEEAMGKVRLRQDQRGQAHAADSRGSRLK